MPGQAVLGYGPSGQHYNMQNPVYQTTSGLRPGNAAGVGNNAPATGPYATTPMRISPESQMQFANQKPHAWTALGKQQAAQQQQGSGNPFMDAINNLTGGSNIQTSITPQNIYSPQQTNEAVNSAVASQHVPLPWLQGQFAGRGMSINSPGVIGASMPAYAAGVAGGQQAAAQIPFQDALANAQHTLAGQTAREGEGTDWYRLMSGAEGVGRNFQMNSLQSLLSLLGSLA